FVAVPPGGSRQLWIRSLDATEARVLPGTSNAFGPVIWSPDSTSIAFATDGELRRITLVGGAIQRICALPRAGFDGGTWSRQGTIVFGLGGPEARLFSVSDAGGEAKPLTEHD